VKKFLSLLFVMLLLGTVLTGCGSASPQEIKDDYQTFLTHFNKFNLGGFMGEIKGTNDRLMAGNYKKDADDFKKLVKEMPGKLNDNIGILNGISLKTSNVKSLRAAYVSFLKLEKDLFNKNVDSVNKASTKLQQEALELKIKAADAEKKVNELVAKITAVK